MIWLRDHVPTDTILCNGAGNYASWIHRFYRFREFMTHVAPTSASMGYGMPAAIAMQRLHPERLVLSVNGDGDFLMSGQEFAIAVQYRLPIIVMVCDNGMYGTIRMHQEREFPGRVSATELHNPDFDAYARAFGGFGAVVKKTSDFPAAFQARESGLPSIIHSRSTRMRSCRRLHYQASGSARWRAPNPETFWSGVGKVPVQLPRPAVERPGLQRPVVDPHDRRDLGKISA